MQSAVLAARDAWNDPLRTFVDTGPTQSSTSGRIFERLGAPQRRGVRFVMTKDLAPTEGRRGTRRLMLGSAIAAVGLLIVLMVGRLLLPFKTADNPSGPPTKFGPAAQGAGGSAVAKKNPAGQEDATGGRARQIKESSEPLSLTAEQRQKIRGVIAREGAPRRDGAEFELQIGAAVPRQTELHDLPPGVAEAMSGYWDDQYVLVRDTMVIVDRNSRRVAAIVPGAG